MSGLFVKPWGEPSAEWQDLGTIVNDTTTLTPDGDGEGKSYIHFSVSGPFSFTFRLRHKNRIKIAQEFGFLKKPRCTYKTIKRDCAKRNRI